MKKCTGYEIPDVDKAYFDEFIKNKYKNNKEELVDALRKFDYLPDGTRDAESGFGFSYKSNGKTILLMGCDHAMGDYVKIIID